MSFSSFSFFKNEFPRITALDCCIDSKNNRRNSAWRKKNRRKIGNWQKEMKNVLNTNESEEAPFMQLVVIHSI
jgi:hypothetical protein